jgi:hypothetical protein
MPGTFKNTDTSPSKNKGQIDFEAVNAIYELQRKRGLRRLKMKVK